MARTREFYGLSKADKILYLSGVPIRCLKNPVEAQALSFAGTSLSRGKKTLNITPARQAEVFQELLSNIDSVGYSSLYAIGSYPTEQASNDMAALVTRSFFQEKFNKGTVPEIKWIDLGRPDWEFLKSGESCDLAVIHGISDTSELKRLDLARDFCRRCESATTLVLACVENILKFTVNNLKLSPDVVFQLAKTTHEVFL